jgi:type IV secretory pathway VirB2 component (pilin)
MTKDRDDEYYCQQQLAQQQRRYDREQVMRQRYAAEAAKTGKDFNWNDGDSQMGKAAKAVASPFMDVLGTLFGILSGFLYLALAIVILAAIGISFIPAYAYTDLLPLPTLSLVTRVLVVLTVLFAAMTASSASQACHAAARGKGAQ